jgi:hypothetical protein
MGSSVWAAMVMGLQDCRDTGAAFIAIYMAASRTVQAPADAPQCSGTGSWTVVGAPSPSVGSFTSCSLSESKSDCRWCAQLAGR